MRIEKDPDAILDFAWDWSAWLQAGETITAASVEAVGVELAPAPAPAPTVVDGTLVRAWLSGGAAMVPAFATCRVTTSAGRIDERTITLVVVNR